MTYEEKRVWLNRYRLAEKEARRLNEQIAADTCYTLRWVYARHRKAVDQLDL